MKSSYSIEPMRSPVPAYSGSSKSMTSGFTLAMPSASFTVFENSRSTITILASAWSKMNPMVAASSRVLMVLSTPPVIGTP